LDYNYIVICSYATREFLIIMEDKTFSSLYLETRLVTENWINLLKTD